MKNTSRLLTGLVNIFVVSLSVSLGSEIREKTERREPYHLRTLYMTKACRISLFQYLIDNDMVQVETSMLLQLAPNATFGKTIDCIATYVTPYPNERLLLHFEDLHINYQAGTSDRLRIYDGVDLSHELTNMGLYGKYAKGKYELSSGEIHDFVSSGRALTMRFVGVPTKDFFGFKAIITVFRDQKDGKCPEGFLKCLVNEYCIPSELYCNGHQVCGLSDPTGQEECKRDSDMSDFLFTSTTDLGLMVGCAISIFVLMVVVMWLGIVCIKRARFKNMWRRRRLSDESTESAVMNNAGSSPPATFGPPPPYMDNYGTDSGSCLDLPPPYSESEQYNDNTELLDSRSVSSSGCVNRLVEQLSRSISGSDPHQGFSVAADSIVIQHGTTVGRSETNVLEEAQENLILAEEAQEVQPAEPSSLTTESSVA